MKLFHLFTLLACLSAATSLGAPAESAEKKIFVKCTPEELKATFGENFSPDSSQKFYHPISGEELALHGYRELGDKIFEDQRVSQGSAGRRRVLDRSIGDSNKYEVFCHKGEVVVVTLTWPGTLGEFFDAMKEKYQWNISRKNFQSDVNNFLSRGMVYIVKDDLSRLITATIGKVNETSRVKLRYYQRNHLREEIDLLVKESENKKKQEQERYKKAKDALL